MRCSCGAEIPAGAVFCGKCGKKVEYDTGLHCSVCGAELYPGAGFCGKCGAVVKPETAERTVRCRACGATLYPGAKYCGKCRAPVSEAPAKATDGLRSGTEPVGSSTASGTDNRSLAKKLLIIALVLGICLIVTGVVGKISMGKITGALQNTIIQSGGESEMEMILGEDVDDKMAKLIISVIKNDSSGFAHLLSEPLKAAASEAGQSIDATTLNIMVNAAVQEVFDQMRNEIIKDAGAYWPLLQAMAYYRELLIAGLIIAIAAAAAWLLNGGKISDVKELKLMPVVYIGAGWIVLVIGLAIAGFAALKIKM